MKKPQILLNSFMILLCALVVFPFILVISVSLSSEANIAEYGYSFFPRQIDFAAYTFIFRNPTSIINAYKVTFLFSVVATLLSVLLMSMIAYPLSRKITWGRGKIAFYLYFTMLFSGGLAPTYILITRYLRLGDSIWVYILPSLISPWYVFMMRSFFDGIPESIVESTYIDGANEYIIFFLIIMPLSKPVLATVALFIFLTKWNDWYTSMLYINKETLVSLQYLLQRIMLNIQLLQNDTNMQVSNMVRIADIPAETVRMAMAVVAAGPMLLVFPLFQQYFVRGLTVGSVKG